MVCGENVGECACPCMYIKCVTACVLCLPASIPNTHLCLSVWASDWGPWAQLPRKRHQSKQRGGTEPREYGDTKGLPSTVEDFRRGSHKAELPLNSEARIDAACCASNTLHWNLRFSAARTPWDFKLIPCLCLLHRLGIALLTYANDYAGDGD